MVVGSAGLFCLALNVYFEARSEDLASQYAVAEVTLNRVASPNFPDDVCEVVWQRKQFSWTHDGKSDKPKNDKAWRRAVTVAGYALEDDGHVVVGYDALYYHADYVKPYWSTAYERIAKVGRHIFYGMKKG
jgi:spore germination cell wall hydrolase CwlJ-like protein